MTTQVRYCRSVLWATILCVLTARLSAAESEGRVFPFVLPWDDATPSVTDCSGWGHRPAGKLGHIRAGEDGHFHAGPERIRFLGVNLSFGGGMPEKTDGEKIAGRLAKFGVNVVRFHHMDTGKFPDGIRDPQAKTSGEPHPEALDRLDYFIQQLKQRGIYANINLLVGRPFNAADGLPAEIEPMDWKDRHLVGFFNARQLELQKDYARRLLTQRNPYTELTLAEDPAVAFVEINNEQGLIHGWLGGSVDGLPAVFREELKAQWNKWLKQRYATSVRLREAWAEGAQAVGQEMLKNGDFAAQLNDWHLEQHAGAQAQTIVENVIDPALPAKRVLKLSVAKAGSESWHVQFNQADLRLQAGQSYTVRFWAKADATRSLSVIVGQAHEPWSYLGLSANPSVTPQWREHRLVFTATQSDDRARLTFGSFGPAGANVWLAGISLKPGGVEGLKAAENLDRGPVELFAKKTYGERTPAAQKDWMRFLQDTEERYWMAMYRFLKEELKVKALVTGTIVGCSTPNLMAKMDWVDTHSYWQHPHFPRRPWDAADWIVNNKTMVNERGGTLPGLALKRVAGKPHACTEYNHPAPNTYSSEGFLLLAAYAALQDWDAIYVYSYAHTRNGGWDGRKINGFFDIDQHPTKMATLPAAAAMFVRGDVKAAQALWVAGMSREREADLLRRASAWSLVDAGTAGIPSERALAHRVGLITEGRSVPAGAVDLSSGVLDLKSFGGRVPSDTGELIWDWDAVKRGVVTVNTPGSKAVIGFGGGKAFPLGEFTIEPGQGMQQGWSAITVTRTTSAGGNSTPSRWLITATGYAENTDMKWSNPEKSSVGRDWGTAPSQVEGVPAKITMTSAAGANLQVWSLDERGQRKAELPVQRTPDGRFASRSGRRGRRCGTKSAFADFQSMPLGPRAAVFQPARTNRRQSC